MEYNETKNVMSRLAIPVDKDQFQDSLLKKIGQNDRPILMIECVDKGEQDKVFSALNDANGELLSSNDGYPQKKGLLRHKSYLNVVKIVNEESSHAGNPVLIVVSNHRDLEKVDTIRDASTMLIKQANTHLNESLRLDIL